MKLIKALFGIMLTIGVIYVGDNRMGKIPPPIRFLDPFNGCWQNLERVEERSRIDTLDILGLHAGSYVVMEERGVPHISAQNDHDLYFLQGYLTAKDRLWQMELQTHAAAGRLSEILGEQALAYDLEQRRIGMAWAAERALEFGSQDSLSMSIMTAYSDGVNRYIQELTPDAFPIEYKLLDYSPEEWTPLKSCLLLKNMAKMLNGTERDRANTEARKLLGAELFFKLFPDQQHSAQADPIVPHFNIDSIEMAGQFSNFSASESAWETHDLQPHFVGSNNWAVAPGRTENGSAILCNDPHLRLSLPSIWYEIQLTAPGINCYGVSLPGAPGITIGFNDSIAWGVTNAGRDVKDYYAIDLIDPEKGTYRIGKDTLLAEKLLEEIRIRGAESVVDTVLHTVYGPIAHSKKESDQHLALRWLAHDPSNELLCFYGLNRGENLTDYRSALSHYQCPAQNFAYADVHGNIAIWQQGKFKVKARHEGRFVMDGSQVPAPEAFIPQEHNPHMINPERGFVSSANQAPTDASYPYYYSGVYEEFRNRTINRFLANDSSVTVEDMKRLQLSNANLLAKEALPVMLSLLDTARFQNPEDERPALAELQAWNYHNDAGSLAATAFEIWWDELNNMLWDEFNEAHWDQELYYRYSWEELLETGKAKVNMRDPRFVYPMAKVTIGLLQNEPDHIMFDHRYTNDKQETARDIVYDSFYWAAMKFGDIIKYEFQHPSWGHYQGTRVQHLLRQDAFSSEKLFVGGSEHAPNATTETHGPSWRMIVEMDPDRPKAWGALPGGQSGSPGAKNYLGSLPTWVDGEYHELNFLRPEDPIPTTWSKQAFIPLDR